MNKNISAEYINMINRKAELLKEMGNPIRLCILKNLFENEECSVTFFTECMNASQSTISQHLKRLKAVDIVDVNYEGTSSKYFLKDATTKDILEIMFKDSEI